MTVTANALLSDLSRPFTTTNILHILQLGVCLWEIVTSQMPIRGAINVPSADDCPSGIISLIHDCMKYHPQDRPSAKEVYRSTALAICLYDFEASRP